ncbi:MAG: amidohydrolase family protein [Colwellia sp.]|nr:amidohydrolase family protein [Colwellia sp.]
MTRNKIIDPHIHLFDLVQGDYQWLKNENPPFWSDKALINKNFSEKELMLNKPLELAGFVHIEAGFDNKQPWREIAWLETNCKLPFKSVAAIDLTLNKPDFSHQVDKLLNYQSVVGCRHILDEQAAQLLSQQTVQTNLAHLAKKQLSFDLQMPLSDKKAVALMTELLTKIPTLRVIIDHSGWPPYIEDIVLSTEVSDLTKADNSQVIWQEWLLGLKALGNFEQCAIKCSGWEMIDRKFSANWQQAVIESCIKNFGDNRVMLASNFPLTLFNQSYDSLWHDYKKLGHSFTKEKFTALTLVNAAHWYCLSL